MAAAPLSQAGLPQVTPMPMAPGSSVVTIGRSGVGDRADRVALRPTELIPCKCNLLFNRYDYVLPSGRVVSYELDQVPTVPETVFDRGQPVLLQPPPLALRQSCERRFRPTPAPSGGS